jgi:hypothetical protein
MHALRTGSTSLERRLSRLFQTLGQTAPNSRHHQPSARRFGSSLVIPTSLTASLDDDQDRWANVRSYDRSTLPRLHSRLRTAPINRQERRPQRIYPPIAAGVRLEPPVRRGSFGRDHASWWVRIPFSGPQRCPTCARNVTRAAACRSSAGRNCPVLHRRHRNNTGSRPKKVFRIGADCSIQE